MGALIAAVTGSRSLAADSQPQQSLQVQSFSLAANRDIPEFCVQFSEAVGHRPASQLENYVAIEPATRLSIAAHDRRLCLSGFAFGAEYTITLKSGLPGILHTLSAEWRTRFSVPDRPPEFDFVAPGRVIPRLGPQTIDLRTVNIARVRVSLLHISDRDLVPHLDPSRPDGLLPQGPSDLVWQGTIDIKSDPNHETSTRLPIEKTMGTLQAGVYAAVAEPVSTVPSPALPAATTGYFVVSDLGLIVYRTANDLTVAVRSLATAAAAAGVDVALIGQNNRELARVRTDGSGYAHFDATALKGRGGERPRAVFAYGAAGEFSWLDLNAGKSGRSGDAPLASDDRALILPQRLDYRPGEEVRLTILLRDPQGHAPAKAPITVELSRPNGALYDNRTIEEAGAGGYAVSFVLPPSGNTGVWPVRVLEAPEGPLLGKVDIEVSDARPPPLSVSPSLDSALIDPSQSSTIDIRGQYAFGAPASFAPGEIDTAIRAAAIPFPAYPDFAFGVTTDKVDTTNLDTIRFTTDSGGKASQPLHAAAQFSATRPLQAAVTVKIFDLDGRAVEGAAEAPFANQSLYLGLKPRSTPTFPDGQPVHFDAIAVGPDGARLEKADAEWEIRRLESVADWSWENGRWKRKAVARLTRVDQGVVSIPAGAPTAIEAKLPVGRYELELFDPKSEAATDVHFEVGLPEGSAGGEDIALAPNKALYNPGDGADIFVKPPFESDVLLAAADRNLRTTVAQHVPATGATVHVDLPRDAVGAVKLTATSIAPGSAAGLPRHANGFTQLQVARAGQRLNVKLDAPQRSNPDQPLPVTVTVGGAGDEPAFVAISAVDEAAHMEAEASPIDFFFPKQSPGASLFELLGGEEAYPVGPAGVDSRVSLAKTENTDPSRSLSLYSGVAAVDKAGKVVVPLAVPDFTGKLRITAIAWSASRTGEATGESTILRPIATTLALPPSLAPDDRLDLDLSLDNVDGPRGEYHVVLTGEGQITLNGNTDIRANLAEHEQRSQAISIQAHAPGPGRIIVSVQGPAGIAFERRFELPVREPGPVVARRVATTVKSEGQLAIDPALLEGLRPESTTLSIAIDGTTPIDPAAIARSLAAGDFGPTEQRVSSAIRLLTTGAPIAVGPILARQHPDGGFGQWSDGESDLWLSAYVMDFLGRAKAAGATLPEGAYALGLDFLARHADPAPGQDVAAAARNEPKLEAAAFAYAVLARAGRVDLATLRYFSDRFLPELRSPLAMAWIASAFAAFDAQSTASTIIGRAAAVTDAPAAGDEFASDLRDQAAFAATVAECGGDDAAVLAKTAQKISELLAARRQLTAQEGAWLLRASPSLPAPDDSVRLRVDGETVQHKGIYLRSSQLGAAARLPTIKNAGKTPLRATIMAIGVPAMPDQHENAGYDLQRAFFDLQGKPLDPSTLKQNDLALVVLSGRFTGQGDPHPIILDPIPAGWTLEAPEIPDPAIRYPWLKELTGSTRLVSESQGLITVPKITGDRHEFKIAFVVRAAWRGQFAMPPALIEDLSRPALAAHSASGRTKVDPTS